MKPLWHKLTEMIGRTQKVWYVALLILVLVFPGMTTSYWTDVAFFFGLYILLGLSLNIIVGYAGLFNLGHAAFYAVGAYTTAILNTMLGIPVLYLLPISALAAAFFAYLITKPILHLRGDYLAIVTIGFAEIVRISLINNIGGLTGGPNGLLGISRPELFGMRLYTPTHFYYLVWFLVIMVILAMVRLEDSRLGRAWNYVREDELAAEAMGIDATRTKMLAFVVGSALAGVAGNIYAAKMTMIAPESFGFWESVVIFSIVILGGMGSIPGVVVGAFGMVVLPEIFRGFAEARMLIFGAAMVLMMLFRPQGLWPSPRARRAMESQKKSRPSAKAGTA